jgi:hypothetical protein
MSLLDRSTTNELAHRSGRIADEMAEVDEKELMARFEELTVLEHEFEDVELEMSATHPHHAQVRHYS